MPGRKAIQADAFEQCILQQGLKVFLPENAVYGSPYQTGMKHDGTGVAAQALFHMHLMQHPRIDKDTLSLLKGIFFKLSGNDDGFVI